MLKHLRNSFRIVNRYWQFSLLNIVVLSLGIAASVLIFNYCYNETSYDSFHEKASRIYILGVDANLSGARFENIPYIQKPVAKKMVQEFSCIEEAVRLSQSFNTDQEYIFYNKQGYPVEGIAATDSNFFKVFTLPMLYGNSKTALTKKYTAVITRSAAKRIFGKTDARGEKFATANKRVFTVTGITEDYPSNSHLSFDVLYSMNSHQSKGNWSTYSVFTYLLLKENSSVEVLKDHFPSFVDEFVKPKIQVDDIDWSNEDNFYHYFVLPLEDIYLSSFFDRNAKGKETIVFIMFSLGILILVMASLNYINLSIAQADNRAKEIGVRKLSGASRLHIIVQFLLESVTLSFISLFLGMLMVEYTLPYLNQIMGKHYVIDYFRSSYILPALFLLALILGLLSGLYPAFKLSSFDTQSILCNSKVSGRFSPKINSNRSDLRNILVVIQITSCIIIIIFTLTVKRQLQYMQDKNLGERENVLVIQNPYTIKDNAEAFKKALLKNEQIVSVSYSSTPLSGVYSQYSHALPNIDRNKEYWLINVLGDHDFFKTLGLNIIEGRNFSSDNPDDTYSVLINESALKTMDIKDPINKKIRGNPWSDKRKEFYTIIGVFEDFHNVSLRSNIDKMIVYSIEDLMHQAYAVLVKLKNAENPEAITYVKDVWSNFAGGKKFNGYLLKDKVESIYSEEKATQQVFKMFSFLSLAIAGLGLYGLALFLLSQREKEMGIRKTLGASMKTLRIQLSRRFIMWVFFATLLAWPLSYLLITNWLNNFAYHVQPNFLDFIISFLLVSLMVFLVVLYQVVKTSKVNPAQALKDE